MWLACRRLDDDGLACDYHSPGVSEETRARILKIAEEVGYRPSQIARGLGQPDAPPPLACWCQTCRNPFFAQIVPRR